MRSLPSLPPGVSAIFALNRRLVSHVALGCLLAVLLDGSALAAPPGAALKKFEEGSRLFAANNPAEALRAFQASLELEPSPNTLFKIAKCYLALERTASAYTTFRRAAKEAQDRIKATGEQRFAPTQAAAEAEVAQLEKVVPRLMLALPAEIPGQVSISVDGGLLPASVWASPIEIDPGPHRLTAIGPLITPYESSFEVKPAEIKNVEVPLVRRPTGTILLAFAKQPIGLSAVIDAQQVPPAQVPIPIVLGVGLHKVVVSAPGFVDAYFERTLHDQESMIIQVNLYPAPRPRGIPKTAFLAVTGCAVGVALIGAGFGAKAQLTANEQTSLIIPLRDPSLHDEVRTEATIANVAFGVSGTLALAALSLAIITRWREPGPPPQKVAAWRRGKPPGPFHFLTQPLEQAAAATGVEP